MNNSETGYDWDLSKTGGHSVVAMQVVDDLAISGLPAAKLIAESLVDKLEAASVRALPEALTAPRIQEALEGVLAIRVMQVRHKHVQGFEGLHYKQIRYPAFMWPIYRSVGDVISPEDAVELRVKLTGSMSRFEKPGYEWKLVDETLRALESYGIRNGLELATALPKGKDGDLSILTFLVEKDRLVSHVATKTHGDALVRACLDFQFGKYVWGTPRWEYNNVSWYTNQMRFVVYDAFRS